MNTMKNLCLYFGLALLILPRVTFAQTDTDGAMYERFRCEAVTTNNNDEGGTDEHTWVHWLRDNPDYGNNGTGWEVNNYCWSRNCGGGCSQWSGSHFTSHTWPANATFPTQWYLLYRYWEDDHGGRCSYDTHHWWHNHDDDYRSDNDYLDARPGCPRVSYYYGWRGANNRNRHYSDVYWTSPRPDYLTASTTTVCGTQNVTLSTAGKACSSSIYRWYRNGAYYTQGTAASITVSVNSTQTWWVYTRDQNSNSYDRREVTITVTSAPTVDAGVPVDQCGTGNFTQNDATVTGGTGVTYSWAYTSYTGTAALTGATTLDDWVLNPSTNSGSGLLTLTVSSTGCPDVSDSRLMSWDRPPTGAAGSIISQCFEGAISAITMSGASMNGYGESVTGTWSTQAGTGSGTWSQNTSNPAAATFTPTSNSGSMTMRLRIESTSGECSGNTYDYTTTITWFSVDGSAGSSVSQCSMGVITTTGATATGAYSSYSWSYISGTGTATIANTTSLTGCTLTPTSAGGTGTLRLTIVGTAPCPTITRDKPISWSGAPLAYAGTTINSCSGSGTGITMTGATGGGLTGAPVWTGGGSLGAWSGTGNDPAIYVFTPNGGSPTGSFTATLTVTGISPCTGTATNTRTVSWTTPPTGAIGSTVNSCNGSAAVTLTGATAGGSLAGTPFTWSVNSGGGSVTGSGSNPATYQYTTPGATGTAQVQLVLHAAGHCTTDLTFTQDINWGDITATSPATITSCGDVANINMSGTATGQFSSVAWTGQTGGVWNTTNPTDPAAWIFDPTSTSGNFNATLTVTGTGVCAGETATSITNVDWDVYPTVDAGTPIVSCTGSGVAISMGSTPTAAGQHDDVAWTTSSAAYGGGIWTDGGTNPDDWTFTPTTVEGFIVAQLEVQGDANCNGINVVDVRTIQWSAPPVISSIAVTNQTDCIDGNGTIDVTATGNGPLLYSSNGGTNYLPLNILPGLVLGTYNVQVQDTVGCTTNYGSVAVGGPVPVTVASVVVTQSNQCAGGTDGEITLTGIAGGGGGPFAYTTVDPLEDRWYDIDTDPYVIDSLPGGTFPVIVQDQFGCESVVYSTPIAEPNPIVISALNITDVVGCGSSGVGAIDATASGGTGTLTYWLDSIQDLSAPIGDWSSLPAGSYEVMISDANLCNTIASAQINAPWTVTAGDDIYRCGGGITSLPGQIIGQLPTSCTTTLTCSSGCAMPSGYCTYSSGNNGDERITNVSLNGASQNSTNSNYTNFTGSLFTTLDKGTTYTFSMSMSVGGTYTEYFRVWFDWNRDGDFADAGENNLVFSGSTGTSTRTLGITVPAGAVLGETRMRVGVRYNGDMSSNACGTHGTWGEVEDYRINIIDNTTTTPTASYSWSPSGGASLTGSVSPATTSTYTLTVDDGCGCVQDDDIKVNVSNETTTASITDVDCFGNTNGCVTLNPVNGIQPYLMYGPSSTVQVYGGSMRPITVNNTSGTAHANHPVKMTVPYSAGMRADFGDIRFYDVNQNQLSYWIEEVDLSTDAIVWVKLVTMPTGNSTVYMTYGNTANTNASNGDNVFEFFDDFNSFDAAKWTSANLSATQLGTPWSYYGGSLSGGSIRRYFQSNSTFTGARVLESKNYQVSINCNGYTPLGIRGSNTNGASFLPHRCGNRMYVRDDGGWVNYGNNHPSYLLNQWLRYVIRHNNANANFGIYDQGGTLRLNANQANSAISGERVRIGSRHDSWNGSSESGRNYNVQWDWLFVRSYISVEPTVTFGGVELPDNQFCGFGTGPYNFNVMDVAACNNAVSATVDAPSAALSLSFSMYEQGCYVTDGTIDLTVTGGTQLPSAPPAYYYTWAGPGGFSSSAEDLTALQSGVYSLTVADDNACSVSGSTTLNQLVAINSPGHTWTGNVNTLWQEVGNWDCRLPDATSGVVIPGAPIGGNNPEIQIGIIGDVFNIDIQGSALDLLDIQDGGLLIIHEP
jgi:hypothetical protein